MITILDQCHISIIAQFEQSQFKDYWNESQVLSHLQSGNRIWGDIDESGTLRGELIVTEVLGEWEILRVAVDPRFRRQGIAKRLLEILDSCCLPGHLIFLEVRASNNSAQELYLSCGFVESGVRKKYYSDEEDAVLMMKSF